MRWSSLIGHVLELYPLAAAPPPADRTVDAFFRERKYLGSRDRAVIAEWTWRLLRGRLRWEALAQLARAELPGGLEPAEPARDWLLAWHAGENTKNEDAAPADPPSTDPVAAVRDFAERQNRPELFAGAEIWNDWASRRAAGILRQAEASVAGRDDAPLALGWPAWLAAALGRALARAGEPEPRTWVDHARALLAPAGLSLRVNTAWTTRELVMAELAAAGIEARPSPLAPEALVVGGRVPLHNLHAWQAGLIEPQDEGSQLIAPALAPRADDRILDACAGGGGKTLHLAALAGETGEIYATDNNPGRMADLARRAHRAGFHNVFSIPEADAAELTDLDGVLIDAPCSGAGTLRRRPDMLWKMRPEAVERAVATQRELLERWAPAVRPGGALVYATCSFIPEENDGVIGGFVETHPEFRPEDPLAIWRARGSAAESLERGWTGLGRQLVPGWHGCDGFYVARLVRCSSTE